MKQQKGIYLILLISLIVIIAGLIIWQHMSQSGKTSPEMHSINPLTLLNGSTNFSYTYQQPDGNRFLPGKGSLPDSRMIDIQLPGKPRWIVAAPHDGGSIWAVVLEDGQVRAYRAGTEVEQISIMPETSRRDAAFTDGQ